VTFFPLALAFFYSAVIKSSFCHVKHIIGLYLKAKQMAHTEEERMWDEEPSQGG
jgi:hypothetical protein